MKSFKQSIEEGYRNYDDNRTGFVKRKREDDEYHTPDPTTRTHRIGFDVSKDGGEKHHRTVTISHSTKSHDEAKASARAHLEKQGYTIHEAARPTSQVEKARKLGQFHKKTGFTGKNPFKDHPSDVQQAYADAKKPVKEEKMTDEKPPFDGPYTKTPSTVTDKSGAKHGPMSRARTLARDAMKKVSSGLPKKKLNESRKAEIVKQASKDAKKKTKDKEVANDKFQAEPTLDSQVIKTD